MPKKSRTNNIYYDPKSQRYRVIYKSVYYGSFTTYQQAKTVRDSLSTIHRPPSTRKPKNIHRNTSNTKPYNVTFTRDKIRYNIGSFATLEEAEQALAQAVNLSQPELDQFRVKSRPRRYCQKQTHPHKQINCPHLTPTHCEFYRNHRPKTNPQFNNATFPTPVDPYTLHPCPKWCNKPFHKQ